MAHFHNRLLWSCIVTVVVVFVGTMPFAKAQSGCKLSTAKEGSTVKTCFHKNGKPSSVETWDAIHRQGSITCYNAAGKQIFYESLRRFGGHASVYLDYYANGQIKKAEYSSAPDGGIQFWHTIYKFDEAGNQTDKIDMSQPDGHPVLVPVFYDTSKHAIPIKTPVKTNPITACAAPYSTV